MRLRTITLALIALALAGCGGADRSGKPADGTSPGAEAGSAAAYVPAGSLLYIHADRDSPGWRELAPVRDRLRAMQGNLDGLGAIVNTVTGVFIEPEKDQLPALAGESAFAMIQNGPPADPDDFSWRWLSYDTVVDRKALDPWLAKNVKPVGEDGAFTLYSSKGYAIALSDTVLLSGAQMADLRDAIARGTGGGASLADEPDFRAALARDHDANAVIRGYSRGDLADAIIPKSGNPDEGYGGLLPVTTALGLTKTAFDSGPAGGGIWVHAHPSTKPGAYVPAKPFEPTLLKRASKDSLLYLGLSDLGAQLGQLAQLFDGGGQSLGTDQTSADLPGWLADEAGISVAQMKPFLTGEQAWWFGGLTTGAAFRPSDGDAALATAQQVVAHFDSPSSSFDNAAAERDGDVVSLASTYTDPDEPAPADPKATVADEPGFDELLHNAALPAEVSVLVYADPRPLRARTEDSDKPAPSARDLLGRMLLWMTPVDGGYDLSFYAEIVPA